MTVTIYDYANDTVEVEIPAKTADDIEDIYVHVLSGDETGSVKCKNGDIVEFGASDCRLRGFDDGWYIVTNPEAIKKWLEFEPTGYETASYQRQRLFR